MKAKGWILTVAIIIICSVIAISRNGNIASGKTINGSAAATTQSPGYHYVMNQITLSREWSSMPVQINNGQTINYLIKRGQATEYEVRDADHPERVYKFHPWEIIHTDMTPIYNWQWRVSGDITSGPVVLEYNIGTLY